MNRVYSLARTLVMVGLVVAVGAARLAAQTKAPLVEAERGMVVSVSPEASDAGVEVLRRGGNAVDAAVATALALAVTFPEAGNIGGGGFMMICPGPGQQPVCVEYRETAPAAVDQNTFVDLTAQTGHKVVGVPGTVCGLALAHEKFGTRPWAELCRPAIRLAEEGFAIDAVLAATLNRMVKSSAEEFPEFGRVFGKPGEDAAAWKVGDRLVQPELAGTLKRIAAEGADAFYHGAIAEQIVAEMRQGGGYITSGDLAAYRANVRKPVHGTYRGYDVYAPPPPSSGGTCLVQMLNVLEQFDLREKGRYSAETLHLMAETMRRAYCDRAKYLGDPGFSEIPGHLTSKQYARQLAAQIDARRATPSESLAGEIELADEGPSTTHFSVADASGMAVANTYTLQNSYGSRVVVRGAGFLLNNEMTDFNWRPGVTDRTGRIGTAANLVAPGKRMLSSQTPTLVMRDGRVVLVTGSPGGRTIINTALCVVLNVLEFEMDLRSAVDAPRMHHQWLPDRISMEATGRTEFGAVIEQLQAWGHRFTDQIRRLGDGYGKQGDAHSIMFRDGKILGAADMRRTEGKAAGY